MSTLGKWSGLLICIVLMSPAYAQSQLDVIDHGRAIVEFNCSGCHGVHRTGLSRNVAAPLFRDVVKRYPLDNLAEALAEGIMTGHPDMPQFVFRPEEIGAILSYLATLK